MEKLPNKSLLPILNLDIELFDRNNVSIAYLVIISSLIKNREKRKDIIEKVSPDFINVPYNRYLFEIVVDEVNKYNEIDLMSIINKIPAFEPKFYDNPSNERSLSAKYFTFAQILDFEPTSEQVSKAMDMIIKYAHKRGFS